MDKYKVDTCALLEIILLGKVTVINQKYMILCSGYKSDKHEFGTEYYINKHTVDNFLVFEPVNETVCNIGVKLKCYNLIFISTLAPTEKMVKWPKKNSVSLWKWCMLQFPIIHENTIRGIQC